MNAGVGHDRGTPLCRHPPETPAPHVTVGTGVGGTPSHDATRPPVRLAPRYPARMPVDYSGQDLRGRDFSGQDLYGANLYGADLTGANLSGADLSGANFTNTDLTDAVRRPGISRADLDGAEGLDTARGLVD